MPVIPASPLPASRTLHFAKFVSGGGRPSSLVLVNPSDEGPARGELAFFDQNGEPWPVVINGGDASASVAFNIQSFGSAVFTPTWDGPLVVGSARAKVSRGVVGGVLRLSTSSKAAVNIGASRTGNALVASVERVREAGRNTELVVSSVESAAELDLELRDRNGTVLPGGRMRHALPANGQLRRTLDRLFPEADTDDVHGTVIVTSGDVEVTTTALAFSDSGEDLVNQPVVPMHASLSVTEAR